MYEPKLVTPIALDDIRATRRRHVDEQVELLAEELRKTQAN